MVKGLFDTNRDTIARTKNLTCACAGVGNQTGDQRYLWPLSAMFFRYFFLLKKSSTFTNIRVVVIILIYLTIFKSEPYR